MREMRLQPDRAAFYEGSIGCSWEAVLEPQSVKLLTLEEDDKVAAAVVIPPEEAKAELEDGTLLQ